MNRIALCVRVAIASCLLIGCLAGPCESAELVGYMGPGAGLTMLGALFAVACVLFLAILAPIVYPIRAFLAWRRRCKELELR